MKRNNCQIMLLAALLPASALAQSEPSAATHPAIWHHTLEQMELKPIEGVATPSNTVVRFWSMPAMSPSRNVHQLVDPGQGPIRWDYVQRIGTNLVHVDLSDRGPHIWHGLKTLGVLTMPNSQDLPDHGLPEVYDGVRYLVQVYTNGQGRSYSYANPAHYPRPQDASVACMADLLRGVADREVNWQKERAAHRERAAREAEAELDAIVGRTFDSLYTQSHGTLTRVRVTRREGDHFTVQHTAGIARVRCQEVVTATKETGEVQHHLRHVRK